MEMLPDDHKAKWFAGAALNTAEQAMASVMSTALSRLNSFLDSELEQLLCFDTEIDAEKFCGEKSAIFVIMPEENPNTFFLISLIIQQLYREILSVADEQGGKLKNRCVFFCDEFGTLPKIESAEMMFSASRSRRLQIVPIIQSFAQLDKNYGKEGAEIIVDNTQLTLFGGFAPNSSSAEVLSKALGSRTVLSGSVSRSKNDPSQSLQMIERPLLTPDELKSMPKGQFVVMKTGVHPMKVKLKLFFRWGIRFDEAHPYTVEDHGGRRVEYAQKKEITDGIVRKYHPEWLEDFPLEEKGKGDGQSQEERRWRRMGRLDFLYRMDLSHRAVSVYIYLADRANREGECWPAIPTIARDLKLSQSTVRRALKDLRKARLVETEQRYRAKGGKSSLLYKIWKA